MLFRSAAFLVLGLLVTRAREARAQADDAPPLAVLPPSLAQSLESVRDTIERQMVDGFDAAGLRTTSAAAVRSAVPDRSWAECTASACFAAVGEKTGTNYLASAKVETARRAFTVHLTVVNAQTGRELASETTRCDATAPCPPVPKTVFELAKVVGRTALPLMKAEVEAARPKPSPVAPLSSTPPPPASAVAVSRTMSPPTSRAVPSEGVNRWIPWTALLGGAALAGTGAFVVWKVDGGDTDCVQEATGRTCYGKRSAGIEGWTMLGVGSAAAITGAVLLLTSDSDSGRSIVLTPSSVAMRGTF